MRRIAEGVRAVRDKWVLNRFYRRNKQFEQDTLELFWTLSFYTNFKKRLEIDPNYGSENLTPEQIDNLCSTELSSQLGHIRRRVDVLKALDTQVFRMMEHVYENGGTNPYPNPIFKADSEQNVQLVQQDDKRKKTPKFQLQRMCTDHVLNFNPGEALNHPDGFTVQVKKSQIDHPESGYGVYVDGVILPGTVVAFYPGLIYFPEMLSPELIEGNEYMISRYDNAVIDGYKWEKRATQEIQELALMAHASGKGDEALLDDLQLKKYRNTFGIGNFVNHPPPGTEPNVISYGYDFPESLPVAHRPYIPNVYYKKPLVIYHTDAIMRAVVLVAKRRIEDEELFLNYRYNPEHPYPSWYTQPDEEEAKRRWSKRSWLG